MTVTENGKVYTSNAHGGTISGYDISKSGKLTLFSSLAATVNKPALDLALSNGDHFLYNLNGNNITGFWIGPNGSLTQVTMVSGLPDQLQVWPQAEFLTKPLHHSFLFNFLIYYENRAASYYCKC